MVRSASQDPLERLHDAEPFPTTNDSTGRTLGEAEIEAVADVIRSGRLNRTVGDQASSLEREFAAVMGSRFAHASSSGTAGIHTAVAAVAPQPGDEVIVPPISDYGTVAGVVAQGAIPVFADVDPLTGCLTPETVLSVLSERTRAVVVVHLMGAGAPVDAIVAAVRPRGVAVIEDCAQAYLTVPSGAAGYAGTRGDIGCFSLQQSKHITAGDGGLTITDDAALAGRIRLFADKGWPRETGERTHVSYGLNYRMTELQAAIARVQLGRLTGIVRDRRRTAEAAIEGLTGLAGITLPQNPESHAFWQFPIVLDRDVIRTGCREFAERLVALGVPASGGYLTTPLHLTPAIRDRRPFGTLFPYTVPPASRDVSYGLGDCPNGEHLVAESLVCIPWNERYDSSHISRVIGAVRRVHADTVQA